MSVDAWRQVISIIVILIFQTAVMARRRTSRCRLFPDLSPSSSSRAPQDLAHLPSASVSFSVRSASFTSRNRRVRFLALLQRWTRGRWETNVVPWTLTHWYMWKQQSLSDLLVLRRFNLYPRVQSWSCVETWGRFCSSYKHASCFCSNQLWLQRWS